MAGLAGLQIAATFMFSLLVWTAYNTLPESLNMPKFSFWFLFGLSLIIQSVSTALLGG